MSRIYHNEPLKSIPISTHRWPREWNQEGFERGPGVLVEGVIQARSRHVIEDTLQKRMRYVVFTIKPSRSHRRQFDACGKEMELNFSETQKVRTGFLNSSYKVEAKGQTDRLSESELSQLVSLPGLCEMTSRLSTAGSLCFWMSEDQAEQMDVGEGDSVRLRTKGNTPFIDTVAKLDTQSSTVSHYSGGEAVGGSWTDKVMSVKQAGSQSLPQDQNEGVDDDEWVLDSDDFIRRTIDQSHCPHDFMRKMQR